MYAKSLWLQYAEDSMQRTYFQRAVFAVSNHIVSENAKQPHNNATPPDVTFFFMYQTRSIFRILKSRRHQPPSSPSVVLSYYQREGSQSIWDARDRWVDFSISISTT